MIKNNITKIEEILENKKVKKIALLAPSFVTDFSYPHIIIMLRKLGFDKVVELTFGAKLVNKEYHKILRKTRELKISSVCPGIVETIKLKHPELAKNLIKVDSPMIATAKVCKKYYPKYKTIFISPCNFKKKEAENSSYIDYTIDYQELKALFDNRKIKKPLFYLKKNWCYDGFYNDYTKIYPLAGGLSKTAHLNNVIKPGEEKVIDGIAFVEKYLKNQDKKIKFLDVNFCVGGCIGGPCTNQSISLDEKKKKLMKYINRAKKEKIPRCDLGVIKRAKGISFLKR
jgi:iron only hydrogenase large subunit-like protein